MPFITQGKTNWKYILIAVVLAVIVGGGILIYQYRWLLKKEVKPPTNFLKCNSTNDCILREKCKQICYNKDFQDWYNQNVDFCMYRKITGVTCECENNQCKLVFKDETANWKTYHNSVYNVELKYPSDWQLKEEVAYAHTYEGKDGFFQISAVSGKGLTIDEVCGNEAHHKLEPYGSQPKVENLRVQDKEACLISPSNAQPEAMKTQAALIIQYPQPIQVSGESYNYFILWADQNHINEIVKTLRFIVDATADWKTYSNEEDGFEIKYPSDFTAKDWANKTSNYDLLVYIGANTVMGDGQVSISILKGESKFKMPKLAFPSTLEEVFVGEGQYKAFKVSSKAIDDYTNEEKYIDTFSYSIEHNGQVYKIFYRTGFTGEQNIIEENVFNQMLSTFRFLD